MDPNFDLLIKKYAALAVQVGLNLQPGQKLILHHLRNGGVPIEAAPLIRELVASAYQAGSPLVDIQWRNDEVILARMKYAPQDSFGEFPSWQAQGILDVIESGGAMLGISAIDPDLLSGQDSKLLARMQRAFLENWKPISGHINKNTVNWAVICAPVKGWARKIFPDLPEEQQVPALWDALFTVCRVYEKDPIATWKSHLANLKSRADYLNDKAYRALHYTGPGTDLRIKLPAGHVWRSAGFTTQSGIPFTANIPTEEVFTLPDRFGVEGTVKSTRPLIYAENVIDDFSLTFQKGKVVDYKAGKGQAILGNLLQTDGGSSMLGEVALVPNSSPISQSGILFYNTLLDENASCHLALGNAYHFSLEGGEHLSEEEFQSRGGNTSLVHSDFMVGSGELNVDGLLEDGTEEPVLRAGEWAF